MKQIADNEPERLQSYLAWLLNATKGYSTKIVNPGGVEVWKQTNENISGFDSEVGHFGVTPRQIVTNIARNMDALNTPHPVHLHCNNLGIPGNYTTTLETMQALESHRGHLTHIQFHSYGGNADDQSTMCSRVPELVDYVNKHPNLTVDVGQVMFGKTTSMTGDGPLGYFLHNVLGKKWTSSDTEMEGGCGIVPIEYKNKSAVHALQWAIGLEWYLLMEDPWRIAMSTDHPNGGAFLAYPQIIALLMDRELRRETLGSLPESVLTHCTLADLDREYTMREIAIITRAAPAKILGLTNKGHLATGADGDVTIYQPNDDKQLMFEMPRYVIRRGELILDDGELRSTSRGTTYHIAPEYDNDCRPDIQNWFEESYTVKMNNYEIQDTELTDTQEVSCNEHQGKGS